MEIKGRGALLGLVVGFCVLLPTAGAQVADGSERAAARKLGYEGVEAYQAGQFANASEKLEKAYAVLKVPTLGLWAARALAKQGKLIEAANRYAEVVNLPLPDDKQDVQKKAQADAQSELESAQSSIPSVVISVNGAAAGELVIELDGGKISTKLLGEAVPVNPGVHRIRAQAGQRQAAQEVTLQQHEQKEVALQFVEAAPGVAAAGSGSTAAKADVRHDSDLASRGAEPRKLAGLALVSVGTAGVVFGGITAALAVSKKGSLDQNADCSADRECPPSLKGDVATYNSMRTISSVGLIAGGVLGVGGVVLLLTLPRAGSSASARLFVSPRSVSLAGTF